MRGKNLVKCTLVSAGFIVALSGCGGDDSAEDFGKGTAVAVNGFRFEPNELAIKVGEELQIDLTNQTGVEHNFRSEDGGVSRDLPADSRNSVKVTFDEPGNFTFVCRFHENGGMVGTITVTK